MDNAQLYHWGIPKMKWGERRFQYKDGSLTPAGRERYRKGGKNRADSSDGMGKTAKSSSDQPEKTKPKSISEMSDTELREAVARLQLEKQYKDLLPKEEKTISAGMKFIQAVGKTVGPAIGEASKSLIKDYMVKVGKERLGLNEQKEKPKKTELQKINDKIQLIEAKKKYKKLTGEDYKD